MHIFLFFLQEQQHVVNQGLEVFPPPLRQRTYCPTLKIKTQLKKRLELNLSNSK